jgi:hypothetical protein
MRSITTKSSGTLDFPASAPVVFREQESKSGAGSLALPAGGLAAHLEQPAENRVFSIAFH